MTRLLRMGCALTVFAASFGAGQLMAQDARLEARLDRATFLAVNALVDSARVARLPTAPLVDRALEGAARGSDGGKIISAVRQLSVRMSMARRVLGSASSADEIKAAAAAIDAGVSERDLARLHDASAKRPVTMPLAVLTDLIGRAVPVPTATDVVLQLTRTGARDADLALFQRNVRADIDRGADPTVAATTRARGVASRNARMPKPAE